MKKTILTVLAVLMMAIGASAQDISACPDVSSVASDYQTQVDSHNSVEVTPHPAWASISGAKWIWYQDESLNNPTITETKTFTKSFSVIWPVDSASLEIAADNGYKVWVNGVLVDDKSAVATNFNPATTYDIASKLTGGTNTITVEVTNFALPGETNPLNNPGGLIYKVTIDNDCDGGTSLPEFVSVGVPLLILVLAPAVAFAYVRRKD